MSKAEQGVENQFKGMNMLSSPDPLKQLLKTNDAIGCCNKVWDLKASVQCPRLKWTAREPQSWWEGQEDNLAF